MLDTENHSDTKSKRGGKRAGAGRKRLDADVMPENEGLASKAYAIRLPSYVAGIALNRQSRTGEKATTFVNQLLKTLVDDFLASPAGQQLVKESGWADEVHRAKLLDALQERQKARSARGEKVYEIRIKQVK